MFHPRIHATADVERGARLGAPTMKEVQVNSSHSILHASDADFDAVLQATSRPAIVDFWATWCPPCRLLAPFLVKFAAEYGDRVTIIKVDRDSSPALRARFGVDSIPRLLFFNGDELVETKVGLPDYPVLKQWINDGIAKMTGGEQPGESEAETRFAAAVVAADKVYETAIAPAYKAVSDAPQTALHDFQSTMEAAHAELTALHIDHDEFDRRHAAAETKRDEDIAAARRKYSQANQPLEAAYIATIQAAAEQFAADLAAANGTGCSASGCSGCGSDGCSGCGGDGCGSGKVCQIGDPNCSA
jgi:thioredoxin 1